MARQRLGAGPTGAVQDRKFVTSNQALDLNDLGDVNAAVPASGDLLTFDGTVWVAQQAAATGRKIVTAPHARFTPPQDADYVVVLPHHVQGVPSVALLHCDGADGSATITDSSEVASDWAVSGSARISITESKFGGASLYIPPDGSIQPTANPDLFAFWQGDFTIELWLNAINTAGNQCLYDSRPTGVEGPYPSIWLENGHIVYVANGSTQITGDMVTPQAWHHVAVVREGFTTTLYLDGQPARTRYTDSLDYLNPPNRPLIGASGRTSGYHFNGYLDDIRITKGEARYVRAFTPPTAPHAAHTDPAVILPTAVGSTLRYTVINESAVPLTVAADQGELVDDNPELVIESYATLDVVSDGRNWYSVAHGATTPQTAVPSVEERIDGAPEKTGLDNLDVLGVLDHADSMNLKKVTFENLRTSLNVYTTKEIDSKIDSLVVGLEHSVAVLTISNTPPQNPQPQAFYIVGTNPSGAWAGHANEVAGWDGARWLFSQPRSGETHLVEDVIENWHWNGTTWVKVGANNAGGGSAISDVWMVGDIKQSVLDEAQFRLALPASERNKWVLADGRSVAGTAYSTLTGRNNVPDLRGTFLRGAGNNATKQGWNGGNLNTYYDDTTRLPRNANFNGSTSGGGGHQHTVNGGAHKHRFYVGGGTHGAAGDNASGVSDGYPWGSGGFNVATRTELSEHTHNVSTNGDHSHSVTINGGGDAETAPRTYTVAFYIKVD